MTEPMKDDSFDRFERLVTNVLSTRQEWMRGLTDPRRDINKECGYPDNPSARDYQDLYDREAIASRVVEVLPKESWQVQPKVWEDENPEVSTEFEKAWDNLGKNLKGEPSYYKSEQGSVIWEYLLRADILSGIGHYGIILLGIDDGMPLSSPAQFIPPPPDFNGPRPTGEEDVSGWDRRGSEGQYGAGTLTGPTGTDSYDLRFDQGGSNVKGPKRPSLNFLNNPEEQEPDTTETGESNQPEIDTPDFSQEGIMGEEASQPTRKLIYIRVFPEHLVQVLEFEQDTSSPRFGQPKRYNVTLNDPRDYQGGIGLKNTQEEVHWTRVIHLADFSTQACSSEVFAVPRMRPVLNRLLDIQKVQSGSAEMYWRGAFPGYVFSTHPQLGGEVDYDKNEMKDRLEQWSNRLDRVLAAAGWQMTSVAPQVVDPTSQIDVQIEAICVQKAIPIRIFKGSERGELASSNDDGKWNEVLKNREFFYITPRIIVPTVDRLINLGVLPVPNTPPIKTPDSQFGPLGEEIPLDEFGNPLDDPLEGSMLPPEESNPIPPNPITNRRKPGIRKKFSIRTKYIYNFDGMGGLGSVEQVPIVEESTIIDTELGYSVEWPDLSAQSEQEKAQVAQALTTTLASYVSGGIESFFPPMDFFTRILKFSEEDAKRIIQNATKHEVTVQQKQMEQQLQQMDVQGQAIDQGIAPDPTDPEVIKAQQPVPGQFPPKLAGSNPFPPKSGIGKKKSDNPPPFLK